MHISPLALLRFRFLASCRWRDTAGDIRLTRRVDFSDLNVCYVYPVCTLTSHVFSCLVLLVRSASSSCEATLYEWRFMGLFIRSPLVNITFRSQEKFIFLVPRHGMLAVLVSKL